MIRRTGSPYWFCTWNHSFAHGSFILHMGLPYCDGSVLLHLGLHIVHGTFVLRIALSFRIGIVVLHMGVLHGAWSLVCALG